MTNLTLILHFFLLFLVTVFLEAKPLGVIVWHGMGDTAAGREIKRLCEMIQQEIPGTYVLDIQLGSSPIVDFWNTYFMPIPKQMELACKMIHSDENLADGFHLIGFSQAGLFVRSIAQMCPRGELGSVISIGGPQQGVYGLPSCKPNATFCELLRYFLSNLAYSSIVQSHLVQAQYWQDPYKLVEYRARSQFLADINQENKVNETYKSNLLKARNLVLVRFMNDTIVVPQVSEWFGFYKDNQTRNYYDTYDSKPYKTDSIGLKTLDKQGKLHLIPLPGDHLHFSDTWFKETIIDGFLKNH